MSKVYLSGPDRMARMLCKALLEHAVLTRADFLDLMMGQIAEDRRRRIKNERAFSMEEFEPALEVAVSQGWLVKAEGGFRLTPEGEDLARRSRAGRTHSRSRIM
jgi:hypothetical protein